jgi:Carboxypeptidase regulatory-like domain
MATDLIQDFLKEQQGFLETVRKQMESAARGEAPPPEALLEDRERFAGQARARIDSLKAARAKAIARYDTEIRHQEELLSRVEGEIQSERERLKEAGDGDDGPGGPGGPDKPADDVNLEVKAVRVGQGPRQVTGKVADASGSPLPGLKLELFEKDGDKPSFTATTDKKGEFAFMDVPAGVLTVKLHAGGKVIEKKVSSR